MARRKPRSSLSHKKNWHSSCDSDPDVSWLESLISEIKESHGQNTSLDDILIEEGRFKDLGYVAHACKAQESLLAALVNGKSIYPLRTNLPPEIRP